MIWSGIVTHLHVTSDSKKLGQTTVVIQFVQVFLNQMLCYSVPTDRRYFRTSPKKILEDWSVQDLKIAKRTSKDLFFDLGTIIRFFKIVSLKF